MITLITANLGRDHLLARTLYGALLSACSTVIGAYAYALSMGEKEVVGSKRLLSLIATVWWFDLAIRRSESTSQHSDRVWTIPCYRDWLSSLQSGSWGFLIILTGNTAESVRGMPALVRDTPVKMLS